MPARGLDSGALIGRPGDLEQLMDVWSEVTHGRWGTVLLGGEAGIGKTRLIAEVALEVSVGGGKLVFGACHEDELRPFGPFAGLIEEVAGDGTIRSPGSGLDGPGRAAEQARAVALLRDRVVSWGRQEPTLLVVEDVHWASASTRRALMAVLRPAEDAG